MKLIVRTIALIALAGAFFFGTFEVFPRLGWVDPSIYTAYVFNLKFYRAYSIYGYFYQGSRLGVIVPLLLLKPLFGAVASRAVFAFGLYLLSLVSALVISRFFIIGLRRRLAALSLVALNPLWIAGIAYGGADGPAAVYLFAGMALYLYGTQATTARGRELWSLAAGILFAVSLSSHVYVLLPAFLVMVPLLYLFGNWRAVEGIFAGGVLTVTIFSFLGWMFGMKLFYFIQSAVWANATMSTHIGAMFRAPLSIWILRGMFWIAPLLAGMFALLLRGGQADRRGQWLRWCCCLNLLGPVIFTTLYDRVFVGGDIMGTPSYFNICFPGFFVGAAMLVGQLEQQNGERWRYAVLASIIALFLVMGCVSNYTQPAFRFHHAHTQHAYEVEHDFVRRIIDQTSPEGPWQFVFRTAAPQFSANTYRDYFMQQPRYFDYIDSLVAMFGWSPSIGIRIDRERGFDPKIVNLKPGQPLILLARDKQELIEITKQVKKYMSHYGNTSSDCVMNDPYFDYCYAIYRSTSR